MLYLNKEEYMESLGTSEIEQKDLVPLTFETFINLKKGDTVYFVNDCNYFIKAPYVIDYAKWLPAEGFVYKQISFINSVNKRYADSAGHRHSYSDLYVRTSMFQTLLNRQKTRMKRESKYEKKRTKNNKINEKHN